MNNKKYLNLCSIPIETKIRKGKVISIQEFMLRIQKDENNGNKSIKVVYFI